MVITDIRKHRSHDRRNGDRSFYQSSAWRKTRNAFMAVHPNCIECGKPASVADHKIRVKDGGSALDWGNLQPMCASCHNKKDNNAGKKK
jgi:5-methylcytosine-specific restriction protein A